MDLFSNQEGRKQDPSQGYLKERERRERVIFVCTLSLVQKSRLYSVVNAVSLSNILHSFRFRCKCVDTYKFSYWIHANRDCATLRALWSAI